MEDALLSVTVLLVLYSFTFSKELRGFTPRTSKAEAPSTHSTFVGELHEAFASHVQ